MLLEALAESETLGCGLYHLSIRLGLNPQMEASFIAGRNGGRNCSAVLILALGSICSLKRCSQAIIYFSFFSSSFLPTRKYWETWPQVFSYLPEVKSLVNKNSMHICHVQLLLDKWEGINLSKLKWNLRITARFKSATRKSLQLISLSSFLSFFFPLREGQRRATKSAFPLFWKVVWFAIKDIYLTFWGIHPLLYFFELTRRGQGQGVGEPWGCVHVRPPRSVEKYTFFLLAEFSISQWLDPGYAFSARKYISNVML